MNNKLVNYPYTNMVNKHAITNDIEFFIGKKVNCSNYQMY